MNAPTLMLWLAAGCPSPVPDPRRAGLAAVPHPTAPAAMTLNAEGKALYRQSRWPEARARYADAAAADPEFAAATLNLACAFAREERFADAAAAAAAVVRRSYVPAARDVLDAADLAPLHVRPEMATVRAAMAEAARAWGASVADALLFVARTAPPLRLGDRGTFSLAMNQELFAWSARDGRYRQMTADDGRVLAFARSPDGRRVVYLRAGRLARDPPAPPALRALSVRSLDLSSMALGAPVELAGDVSSVRLLFATGGVAFVEVADPAGGRRAFSFATAALTPVAAAPEAVRGSVVVFDARGVRPDGRTGGPSDCAYAARDVPAVDPPRVEIRPPRGKPFALSAKFGAGLRGLPLPGPRK